MVQSLASPHSAPSGRGVNTHPLDGWQASLVHTLESSHARIPAATHAPLMQVSPVVHASPSSQAVPDGTAMKTHAPLAESHESVVHGLPSLQLAGVPLQRPPLQASPVVQGSPSLQGPAIGAFAQLDPLQESIVHGLLSSQFMHVPPQQVCGAVQPPE